MRGGLVEGRGHEGRACRGLLARETKGEGIQRGQRPQRETLQRTGGKEDQEGGFAEGARREKGDATDERQGTVNNRTAVAYLLQGRARLVPKSQGTLHWGPQR